MKFKTRIKGWKDRHLDQIAVMRELQAAQRRGYTLTSAQQQFWDDIISLYALYNEGSIFDILNKETA